MGFSTNLNKEQSISDFYKESNLPQQQSSNGQKILSFKQKLKNINLQVDIKIQKKQSSILFQKEKKMQKIKSASLNTSQKQKRYYKIDQLKNSKILVEQELAHVANNKFSPSNQYFNHSGNSLKNSLKNSLSEFQKNIDSQTQKSIFQQISNIPHESNSTQKINYEINSLQKKQNKNKNFKNLTLNEIDNIKKIKLNNKDEQVEQDHLYSKFFPLNKLIQVTIKDQKRNFLYKRQQDLIKFEQISDDDILLDEESQFMLKQNEQQKDNGLEKLKSQFLSIISKINYQDKLVIEFLQQNFLLNKYKNTLFLVFLVLIYIIKTMLFPINVDSNWIYLIYFFVRMLTKFLILIEIIQLNKHFNVQILQKIRQNALYCVLFIQLLILMIFTSNKDSIKLEELEIFLVCMIFNKFRQSQFMKIAYFSFIALTFLIIVYNLYQLFTNKQIELCFNLLICLSIAYYSIKQQYQNIYCCISKFLNNNISIMKREEQKSLVKYLLPQHILEKFMSTQQQKLDLTDEFKNATILFADIVGFTKFSNSVQPQQVVNLLKQLFTEFDKLCLKYNVFKVYTIGDCYVVMGIIDALNRNPEEEAKNVIQFGLEMIEIIQKVRDSVKFPELNIRIGIHTGSFIGGVIGTKIVRYDIYGQDVLIANQLESNGEQGMVQISEETKNMIEKHIDFDFEFRFNKVIQIQEKSINCYFAYKNEEN